MKKHFKYYLFSMYCGAVISQAASADDSLNINLAVTKTIPQLAPDAKGAYGLSGKGAVLDLSSPGQVGLFEYYIQNPGANDQCTYTVKASRDDGKTWDILLQETMIGLSGQNTASQDFSPRRKAFESELSAIIEFELNDCVGSVRIRDFRAYAMTVDQRLRLLESRLRQETQQSLDKLQPSINLAGTYGPERAAFDSASSHYLDELEIMLALSGKINNFEIAALVASIASNRGLMGNPVKYKQFQTLLDKVRGELKGLKTSRFDSIIATLSNSVSIVGAVVSGVRVLGETIKNMVADAYSPANAREMHPRTVGLGDGLSSEAKDVVNDGDKIFKEIEAWIDFAVTDYELVSGISAQAYSMAKTAPDLRTQITDALTKQIRVCSGLGADLVAFQKMWTAQGKKGAAQAVEACVVSALGSQGTYDTRQDAKSKRQSLIDELSRQRTRSLSKKIDQLQAALNQWTSDIKKSVNKNPFPEKTDQSSEWEKSKTSVLENVQKLEDVLKTI
jgi:hypothetical protein